MCARNINNHIYHQYNALYQHMPRIYIATPRQRTRYRRAPRVRRNTRVSRAQLNYGAHARSAQQLLLRLLLASCCRRQLLRVAHISAQATVAIQQHQQWQHARPHLNSGDARLHQ